MIRQSARVLRVTADAIEAVGARHRLGNAPDGIDASYDFISSFSYGHVRPGPTQIRDEMIEFLRRLEPDEPRTILELGTARGGTLYLFTRVAAQDGTIVTVDLQAGGPFGGGYPRAHGPFLRGFARDDQKVRLVRGDTHSPATLDRVRSIVGENVDVLFIDGDHTYEGVRSDFEDYGPLVRPGGLIAFHDIVDGPGEAVGGVPRFWKEIRGTDSEEIVSDWAQGGFGIGLMPARPTERQTGGAPNH